MSGPPIQLTEGRIIERFGWTFDDLDRQDSGRTLQTLALMNLATLYPAVLDAVAKHATDRLTADHWHAFKLINSLGQGDD
ncbi:MAG: hypothetical protein ACW99J_15555 [Candidatus Thorarchaeota archaeon]